VKVKGPLASYLRRLLAAQTIGVLIGFTALLQLLDLLDATGDILDRELGLAGVLYYSMLRTPAEMSLALPLAMLIDALFSFYSLAKRQELIAIRAAGLTVAGVTRAMLPVVLGLAAFQFLLNDRLLPQSEARLSAWWQETTPPGEDSETSDVLWLHTDVGLMSVRSVSGDGRQLGDLRIYRRDAQGRYQGRIVAASAQWQGDRWRLVDVQELRLDGGTPYRRATEQDWRVNVTPADLLRASGSSMTLSSAALLRVIEGRGVAVRPASYYRAALYRKLAAPFALAVMLLLALPATKAAQRAGEGGSHLMIALGCGLAFVLSDGLLGALAEGTRLPPLFCATAAPVAFAALGLYWLRRADAA
jgi:lipopolysaccharide export system permease protein